MTEGRDEGLGATTEALKELLGEEGARKLAQAFGGRRLYVPVSPGAHHPITVAIGQELADKLADRFCHARFDMPMLPATRDEIRRLAKLDGWTRRRIARELRCTERWVYKVLSAEEDSTPRQGRLFG